MATKRSRWLSIPVLRGWLALALLAVLALNPGLVPSLARADDESQAFNFTNDRLPTALTEVGRLAGGPAYQAIHASGEFLYGLVYSGGRLEILDVSDPANPFVRSSLDLPFHDGHDLWYGEWETHQYVFIGHRFGGVTMVDVSDPDAPTVVSTAGTIYTHKGLQSVGHYLYYSEHPAWAMEGGLRVLDFANGTLTQVGHWLQGPPFHHIYLPLLLK